MIYEEMPKHISRKFFNYPKQVSEEYRIVFMPRMGAKYTIDEIESWMEEMDIEFRRRSVYLFLKDELQATLFKMRWC